MKKGSFLLPRGLETKEVCFSRDQPCLRRPGRSVAVKIKYRFGEYMVQEKGRHREEEVLEHGRRPEANYLLQN